MKYSITIPAYKAKFLSKCIDSVLAQTYKNFEVIIVNDASPENLDTIVNSYNDERIRYYKNERNCGALDVVDNWNICLSHAKGDYVICMGDDDELAEDCLEQYNILMAKYPNLDIYHGRVKVIDENSEYHHMQEARPEFENVYSMMWHTIEQGRIQFVGDFLYKRTSLILNGGFYKLPLAWGSDFISAYIAAAKKGIANTEKPIFFYRTNLLTISKGGTFNDIKLDAINLEESWYENFIKISNPVDIVDKYYIQTLSNNIKYHFRKKKVYLIAKDLANNNIFRVFHWLRKKNVASLSTMDIMYALITSIKMNKSKK